MRSFAAALLFATLTSSLGAQILTTEVWVGTLDRTGGRFEISNLQNVSGEPGYDNQPAFFPDNQTLVYASQDGDLADTGLGVHAVLVDLRTGQRTPLADARGFSPTPTADGRQLMLLREGRVWLHDLDGRMVRQLTETTTAGYYARFDDRNWVLFMNEPERRIVTYDARRKSLDTRARGATTAPYRVPGQRAVTFVAEVPFPPVEGSENGSQRFLQRLDLRTGRVTTLTAIPFPTAGQHVWTSGGTLLMASGPTIYEWSPAQPAEWTPVYRSDHPDLQGITRIAISPRGDRIALVSTPRHETIIREARDAFNQALASRPPDLGQFYAVDAVMISVYGEHRRGREAILSGLAADIAGEVAYRREPASVEIGDQESVASERGVWSRRAAGTDSWVRGEYMTAWRRTTSPAGTPAWAIESELLVALECSGALCD